MSVMTNEEITAEFEELFGGSEPDEEEKPDTEASNTEEEEPEDETTEDNEEETTEDEEDDSEESDEDQKEEEEVPPAPKSTKQSKQNHAFAEQRLQIKQNEQFIRNLGKLIGFDENASVDDIKAKIKEALIEKEAKENGISVELAKRLDRAEELIQENDRIKLEKKVQEDFSELIDRHNLDEAAVTEFTNYLIENDRNPMVDRSVDIEAEYLKLHYEDMVKSAVTEALAKEEARRKKAEEKAASGVNSKGSDKGESKISSVKDLDDLFDGLDI